MAQSVRSAQCRCKGPEFGSPGLCKEQSPAAPACNPNAREAVTGLFRELTGQPVLPDQNSKFRERPCVKKLCGE